MTTLEATQVNTEIIETLMDTPVFVSCLAQLRDANREERIRFRQEQAELREMVDAVLAATEADPERGTYRIRALTPKEGGGFNVEQKQVYTDGTCRWTKLTYCSSRTAAERALALRTK